MPDQEFRMNSYIPIDGGNPAVMNFWSEVDRQRVMRTGIPQWARKYPCMPVDEWALFPRLRISLAPNGGEWFARFENRADGSLSVNHAVIILREYLTRFEPEGSRSLEWCWFGEDCGGGACWVRADGEEYLHTDGWLADKIIGART